MRLTLGRLLASALLCAPLLVTAHVVARESALESPTLDTRKHADVLLKRHITDLLDELARRAAESHLNARDLNDEQYDRAASELHARGLIERVYNSLETRDRQLQPTLEPRSPGEKFDKFKAALKKYSGLDYATKKLRKMKEKRKAKKAEKSSTTSNTPGDPAPRPIIKITSGNGGGGVVYPNAQSYGTHSTSKPTSYSHYSGHRPSTSTSHYSSASSPPSPKRHGYNPYTHTTGVFDATKYGYTNPSMSNYAAYPHLSPYCHTGGLDASSGFSHTSGSSYGHGSMGGSGGYYGGGGD